MYISIVSIFYRYVNTPIYVYRYQTAPFIARCLRPITILTMGSNAASLYAPPPTTPACAGGGHRVSRQAEVADEAMSVWLCHRCLRSPQRSLDARRPSWCGGSTLHGASAHPCRARRRVALHRHLDPAHLLPLLTLTISFLLSLSLYLSHYLFLPITLSFSIKIYPYLSHHFFPTHIYLFLSPHPSLTLSPNFLTSSHSHSFLPPLSNVGVGPVREYAFQVVAQGARHVLGRQPEWPQ